MAEPKSNKTRDGQPPACGPETDNSLDESRREAIKRLGKYAAYTAPAMMVLLLPKRSLAQSEPR